MVTKELSMAAVEVNCIIDDMPKEMQEKIPLEIREALKKIESKDYTFEYNKKLKIYEQNLLPKTTGIILLLYRDYLLNEEEKKLFNKKYNEILVEIENKKKEMYNPENLFNKTKVNTEAVNKYDLPKEYKEENFFKRVKKK